MQMTEVRGKVAGLLQRLTGPIVRKGWWHWIRFAALLALGSWIGHILGDSPRFADIRYALYQRQTRLQHRGVVYPQHTVLVLLDDDDYWSPEFQAREPIRLDQLAIILDRLNSAGANTVGFDFFLTSPLPDHPDYDFPDYVSGDEKFFEAVGRMCNAGRHVVLVANAIGGPEPPFHIGPSLFTTKLSSLPCVVMGHAYFSEDLRKIPGRLGLDTGDAIDSFSLAIVKLTDPVAYDSLVSAEDRGFRFGRYLTPEDFQPRAGRRFIYNCVAIRKMNDTALRQVVADKIVIVGSGWSGLAYGNGSAVDTHNTPGGVESGAMLHANYVEAELNQDSTFTPISDHLAEVLEWSLAFILAIVAASGVPAFWKWISLVLCLLVSVGLTYMLMQNLGLFLDFFVPFLMIVAHTLTEEVLEMRHELKHARHKLRELNL